MGEALIERVQQRSVVIVVVMGVRLLHRDYLTVDRCGSDMQ